MPHGLLGPRERKDKDEGCEYSGGLPCRDCPFKICVEELDNGERIKFGLAFREDGAQAYLKSGVDITLDNH